MGLAFNRRQLLRAGGTSALIGTGVALTGCAAETSTAATAAPAPSSPVTIGPKPGIALLARNENPYGPSPKAREAIAYAGTKGAYYSGAEVMKLMDMIAERHSITREHVTLSTGSGEVLSAIALAYGKDGNIVAPGLFWDTTAKYAERKGANIVRAPMKGELKVDLAAIEALVDDNTSLVHICNPNNPTGEVLDGDELRAFCKRVSKKATILVDEAYNEITEKPEYTSMMDLVREGHDIIIARTFSKVYGMAGIRVGYAIAAPETSAKIRDYVMSWIAGPGLAGAIACYDDLEFVEFSKGKILEAKEMVIDTLDKVGLEYIPSGTNFMFVKLPGSAEDFRAKMAERDIIIRGIYGDHTNWSRVSMGYIEDVERYIKAVPEVLGA